MIEKIAIQYVSMTDENLRLISCGITIAGAIVAASFHKSATELRRAPYFAYSGLIFFIIAASQLVWLGSIPAITGGFLWALMSVDIIVGLGAGYAFGTIAMARSRDAYGHARMAVLAFIPLANFWLLLTPSKNEVSANRVPTISLLTGALGVMTGFVLLIAGAALGAFIRVETNRVAAEAENSPAMQRQGVDMMLRGLGVEKTLLRIAAEVPSQRINDTTTLLRVIGDGKTLRYVYEVSNNPESLPTSMRTRLVQHNCTYEGLRPIIDAGATIEHVYGRSDGTRLGAVTITQAICESPPEPESPSNLTDADIARMIEASPAGEMYRAISSYYPEEATYLRDSMLDLLAGGAGKEEATSKMLVVGAEIRRRHAGNLRTAPDQSLRAVLQFQTQVISALDDDPILCNRVVMFGPGTIPVSERHRVVALMESAGLLYRTMYEGEKSPVKRAQATDDDWTNLVTDFYAAGGTDDELDLVMDPDIQSPQLCGAMLQFLRVLTDADFPGSDRLRAEMVAAINEG